LLTQHPEYHAKIREEIISVVGETALPTAEQIPKLKLTGHFLQEALRLKGPAPFNGASNIEAFDYNGIHFPAHTHFIFLQRRMSNQGVHDAETFRPERWEDASMTGDCTQICLSLFLEFLLTRYCSAVTTSFQATLPFGGGTRVCPGRQLAMIEATEALAALVRAFDFELDGEHPKEINNFVMMSSPYRVKVKPAASN
jgi:cytochrome P450